MNTDLDHPKTSNATLWTEEGAAFEAMSRSNGGAAKSVERFDVIVIGGGQAGLSVGYHLAQRNVRFVILDAAPRIGDAWRERWDSLHLFSTARFDGLDGMPFPGAADRFPTKDEMGDYLETYAKRFSLPVRSGMRVERVVREGERYVVDAGGQRFEALHVIVAMASYQTPHVPEFARDLDSTLVQLHSQDYRNPSQIPNGDVLVVGAGNSGAEIALDLLRDGRRVWLSGRVPGQVPFDVKKHWVRRVVLAILFRVVFHRLLTVDTPLGRKARPGFVAGATPLIRTRERDLVAAGVRRVGRTTGVRDGKAVLADGNAPDVAAVVWCTGYTFAPRWVCLPVFDEHGEPIQERGVAKGEPGLYFVGQHFLYSASSGMVHGVGRDAQRVARVVERKLALAAA